MQTACIFSCQRTSGATALPTNFGTGGGLQTGASVASGCLSGLMRFRCRRLPFAFAVALPESHYAFRCRVSSDFWKNLSGQDVISTRLELLCRACACPYNVRHVSCIDQGQCEDFPTSSLTARPGRVQCKEIPTLERSWSLTLNV